MEQVITESSADCPVDCPVVSPIQDQQQRKARTPSGNVLFTSVKERKIVFSPVEDPKTHQINRNKKNNSGGKKANSQSAKKRISPSFKAIKKSVKRATSLNDFNVRLRTKANKQALYTLNEAEQDGLIIKSTPRYTSTPSNVNKHSSKLSKCQGLDQTESEIEGYFTPLDNSAESFEDRSESTCENSSKPKRKRKRTTNKLQSTLDGYISTMASNELNTSMEISEAGAGDKTENCTETNDEENPRIMSVTSVLAMFKRVNEDIKQLKSETATSANIETVKEVCAEHVQKQMELTIAQQDKRIAVLQKEVGHFKYKTKVLTEVVQKMHTENNDITQRMENIEISNTRRYATISGFKGHENKDTCIEMLQSFFFEKLQIEITLEDVYPLGAGNTLVMVFNSAADKRLLFQLKPFLKDSGSKVFVNDYFPNVTNEKKRRERDIIKENNNQQYPVQIDFKKGNLMIQNETYKKKVIPPTPEQMIDIDLDHLDKVLKLKMDKSTSITEQRSRFQAFTAPAKSHGEIRDYYMKLKLAYPHARHIVCAYTIQGEQWYFNNDYCDDNEPGAGRYLLQLLQKNELQNRVLFVCRYYGGIKMGSDRFACYVNAAINVLINSSLISHNTQLMQLKEHERYIPTSNNPDSRRQNPTGPQQKPNNQRQASPKRQYTSHYSSLSKTRSARGNRYTRPYNNYHRGGPRSNPNRGGRSQNPRGRQTTTQQRSQAQSSPPHRQHSPEHSWESNSLTSTKQAYFNLTSSPKTNGHFHFAPPHNVNRVREDVD